MDFCIHFDLYLCFICVLNHFFLTSNLHLESHGLSFNNDVDLFILVIRSNAFKFMSYVLFLTHHLSDRPSKVLQF